MKQIFYARIVQTQINELRHLASTAHRNHLEFIKAAKAELQKRRDYNRLARRLRSELE